ncbi:hypothetical protein ACS0PU_007862 [Formica fusca]
MYSTNVHGHPDIEESNINILKDSEDDVMEMEYLKEYEEDLFLKVVPSTSHSDSNNCNMLVPQKKKAIINNDSNELSNEKENEI